MGDLIERLRLLPSDYGGPSYTGMVRERIEAADELARLRAEVEGLREQHGRDSRELRELCAARDDARRERDELRRRIAEALIAHADLFADGEARIRCIVPKDYAGQRVAIVRLDAEEGK